MSPKPGFSSLYTPGSSDKTELLTSEALLSIVEDDSSVPVISKRLTYPSGRISEFKVR